MLRLFIVCLFFTASSLLANSISYLHDTKGELTLEKIDDAAFKPYISTIHNGFNNEGDYWFKVDIVEGEGHEIVEFEYAHLSDVNVYYKGVEIKQLRSKRFPTFLLNKGGEASYYLKVNCKKEAYIPINVFKEQEYHNQEENDRLLLGAYYGVAASIIFLHIFYFILFRKKTYILYALALMGIGSTLAFRDGFVYLLFGNGWCHNHIEVIINMSFTVFLALFSSSYLDLNKYVPKYGVICKIFLGLAFVSVVMFLLMNGFVLFVLAENMMLLSCSLSILIGAYLFNKNIYSKFYAIAYTPILFLALDFYNSRFFGVTVTGVNIDFYRLGGVLEMAVFTFAITYQAKEKAKENRLLQNDIDFKNKELTTHTLQFIERNKQLKELSSQINELKVNQPLLSKEINSIERKMERSINSEGDWDEFKLRFENVNSDFYKNIIAAYPNLTKSELRLSALVKLQLSVKESAALLNLTERSIITSRSRLRKKLGLSQKDNLFETVNRF